MRNFASFDPIPESLKICTYVMKLKDDAIFKENLVNFHASSPMSENLHFDGLVLSKAYEVLDEKVQKSYVS